MKNISKLLKQSSTSLNETIALEKVLGVYIVISHSDDNEKYPAIKRVCKFDHNRILYIGSGILKSRIKGFRKVIINYSNKLDTKLVGHAGAVTYNRRRKLYETYFPTNTIRFYYKSYNNKEESLKMEAELQKEYENEYGELPPLNLSRAKKY